MRRQYKVEALEERAGSGWHITFHPDMISAARMIAVRSYEHGITEIRLNGVSCRDAVTETTDISNVS